MNTIPAAKREISSSLTVLIKFVFPALWISEFGFGTLILFLLGNDNGPESAKWEKWKFLAAWIAGSAMLWWGCIRLKRVHIGPDGIYISNFHKEIRVPFEEIVKVSEVSWIHPRPVTIHFRSVTPFGVRIVFTPLFRWAVGTPHPIVGELRALAHLSASSS